MKQPLRAGPPGKGGTDDLKDLNLDVLIKRDLVNDEPDRSLEAISVTHDGQRVGNVDERHCAR